MRIREARATDVPELTALTGELGYPATDAEIANRLEFFLSAENDVIFVAVDDGDRAIGWMHVALRHSLELGPYVQIAGLVVAATHRSGGIGAQLVARAEEWGRARGGTRMLVHSNVIRERAHQFYLRAGYSSPKTSRVFVKML